MTTVQRVSELAEGRGLPMAQVALAWMLSKPGITAPIIGATSLTTWMMPSQPSPSNLTRMKSSIWKNPIDPIPSSITRNLQKLKVPNLIYENNQ